MLHDPSHYEPPPIAEEIELGAQRHGRAPPPGGPSWPQIAALPVHQEKARLWQRLNDLESVRPMVWINEIPWHEMDVDGELTLADRAPLGPRPGARACAGRSTSGGTCRAT